MIETQYRYELRVPGRLTTDQIRALNNFVFENLAYDYCNTISLGEWSRNDDWVKVD